VISEAYFSVLKTRMDAEKYSVTYVYENIFETKNAENILYHVKFFTKKKCF